MTKQIGILLAVVLVASGCGPAIDGVASIGLSTIDPSLSERDSIYAADQLMQHLGNYEPKERTAVPNPQALPGDCCLERDPRNPTHGNGA